MSRTPRALHNAVADLERALAGRPPESVPHSDSSDENDEKSQHSDECTEQPGDDEPTAS